MRSPVRPMSCSRQKGVYLTIMAIPLFVSVYLLIFLNLDSIGKQSSEQNARLFAQSLVRMQRAIDDLHLDLSHVTNHRDVLLRHIVSMSRNISQSESLQEVKELLPALNRVEHFETYILQSIVRYKPYMLTCDHLSAIQVIGSIPSRHSQYSIVFHGLYGLDEVFLVKPKTELCKSALDNHDDCFVNVNYHVMKEVLLLQQIRHPNVVRLLGYCVRDDELLYVTEAGRNIDLKNVTHSDWLTKLKVLHSVATVFHSLTQSPGGPLGLNITHSVSAFPTSLFVVTTAGEVKLASVGAIVSKEPSCTTDSQCDIRWFKGIICKDSQCRGTCRNGRCLGYNVRRAHSDLIQYYVAPVLASPPEYIRAQVKFTQQKLRDMSLQDIVATLGKWKELEDTRVRAGSKSRQQQDRSRKLKDMIGRDGRVIEMSDIIDAWPAGPGDVYQYQTLQKTDIPTDGDYACPRSLYTWGCVHALRSLTEAYIRCNGDPQCRAMVVYPSLSKPGWLEVVYKSSSEGRVNNERTTLYIKHVVSNTTAQEVTDNNHAALDAYTDREIPSSMLQPCLDDMFHMQQRVRSEREKRLMGNVGLPGILEDRWRILTSSSAITGSSPGATFGHVTLHADGTRDATFIHKEGAANNYLSHLAAYHLDRILGLYRVVPTAYRRLDKVEVMRLQKSSSVFNKLHSGAIQDGLLDGILVVPSAAAQMPLSLPRFSNYTDSGVSLSGEQRRQLEYLLLLWLSGTPRQLKQLTAVGGSPVHTLVTDGFQQGVDELLQFFYACQFPRHTVEILWSLQDEATDYCTLSNQLLYQLQSDGVSPQLIRQRFKSPFVLSTLVNKAADSLIHIVDTCIEKFTEAKVLYV